MCLNLSGSCQQGWHEQRHASHGMYLYFCKGKRWAGDMANVVVGIVHQQLLFRQTQVG